MRSRLVSTTLLITLTALGCANDLEETGSDLDPELDEIEIATDGTAHASSIVAYGWKAYDVNVTSTSDIVAVLDWSKTSANLNLYLYRPSGELVDYSNGTTTRPEEVFAEDAAPGTWRLGIKNKSSSRIYFTLSVTVTPVTTPPPPTVADYPGQPAAGMLFWGAAIGGNGDPIARHEEPSGHPLSVRRTFWSWDKRTTSMVTTARTDHSYRRLPWVSTKTPPWADMAAGTYDAQIDEMLRALDALGKPVWLTIHHEPEGGNGTPYPDDPAGPAGHRAMNKRVRQRMTALGVTNIALVPILMTWTWDDRSGRNPEDWWEPGIYDLLGVDHYRDTQATLLDATWFEVRAWAAGKGVDVAVGEWGMRGTDAAAGQRVRDWYNGAAGSHQDGRGARAVGLCAFDSGLNSPSGSWELVGEQLTVFRQLLGDPRTASVDEL